MQWRKSTVAAACQLPKKSETAEIAADEIFTFMLPVLQPEPKPGQAQARFNDVVRESILQCCEKALELALLLRAQETEYLCYSLEPGTPTDDEDNPEMEVVAMTGPTPHMDQLQVSFTVFGSLVKIRNPAAGEESTRHVLEKAHVVARSRV